MENLNVNTVAKYWPYAMVLSPLLIFFARQHFEIVITLQFLLILTSIFFIYKTKKEGFRITKYILGILIAAFVYLIVTHQTSKDQLQLLEKFENKH